jgi:hypothetical protein
MTIATVFFLNGEELIPCSSRRKQAFPRRGAPPAVVSPSCRFPVGGQPAYEYYFTRRESYQRVAFDTVAGVWHVWNGTGTRFDYGLAWLTGVQRLPNRWFLTQVTDALGISQATNINRAMRRLWPKHSILHSARRRLFRSRMQRR